MDDSASSTYGQFIGMKEIILERSIMFEPFPIDLCKNPYALSYKTIYDL